MALKVPMLLANAFLLGAVLLGLSRLMEWAIGLTGAKVSSVLWPNLGWIVFRYFILIGAALIALWIA